jgi:hypothetical protein
MKTIQPVTVWFNGQEVQATVLGAVVTNDNLQNSATFQYQLFQQVSLGEPNTYPSYLQVVVTNSLSMTGDVYDNWDTNDYAYDWIAQQLNLVITGEYTPPQPPPPTPVPTPES